MRKTYILFLALTLLISTLSSCVYEQIEPVKVADDPPWTTTVLPIMVSGCATISCHAVGKVPPDLSEQNAYQSLTLFGYVNIASPEESSLYIKLTTGSMKDKATEEEKAIILAWIKAGAEED